MLVLLPLHIRSKYQEYAAYVNTDERNTIHISIQIQRIKLKEGIAPRSAKIQKAHCRLKLTTMTFKNGMLMISAAI